MTEAARRERHARAAELRQTPSSTQAGACPMPVRGLPGTLAEAKRKVARWEQHPHAAELRQTPLSTQAGACPTIVGCLPGTLAEAPFEGEWLCDWLSNSGRIVKITDSRMFVAGCPNAVEIKITSFTTCEVDLQGTLCKGLLSEDLTKIKWFPDQVEWSRKQADAAGATGPASRATPTLVEHRSRSRSPLQRREMLPRRSRPASRQQYQPRSPPQPRSGSRSRNRAATTPDVAAPAAVLAAALDAAPAAAPLSFSAVPVSHTPHNADPRMATSVMATHGWVEAGPPAETRAATRDAELLRPCAVATPQQRATRLQPEGPLQPGGLPPQAPDLRGYDARRKRQRSPQVAHATPAKLRAPSGRWPSGRDQAATCTTATTTCQQSIPRPSSTRHGCVAIEIRDVSHGSVILNRQDRAARSRSPAGVATPQRRPRPTRRAHFSSPAPGSVRVSRPQSPALPQDGNCEVAIQTEAGDAQEQQRFAITVVEKSESRAPSMPVLQLQCTVVTREIVEVRYQGTQLPVEVGTVGKVVQHEPGLQKVVVQWKIARIGVIKTRVRSAVLEPRKSADDVNRALFPVNTCAQLEYPPRMPSDEYPISADPGPCRSIFARWVRLLEKVANYEIAKLSRWSPSADLEPDMQDLQKQDFHHLILAAKSAKLRTMQVMKQAMRNPDAALLEELEKRQSMAGIEEHVAKLAKSLGMD